MSRFGKCHFWEFTAHTSSTKVLKSCVVSKPAFLNITRYGSLLSCKTWREPVELRNTFLRRALLDNTRRRQSKSQVTRATIWGAVQWLKRPSALPTDLPPSLTQSRVVTVVTTVSIECFRSSKYVCLILLNSPTTYQAEVQFYR